MKRLLLLAAAAAIFLVMPAAPQTERAVLLRGPKVGRGVDVFGPNALPYERGEYSYDGGVVTVFYIRSYLPPLRDWPRADCGKIPLVAGAAGGPEKLFIHDGGDWGLLFIFGGTGEKPCPFIEAFLARFRYFLRLSASPFPAAVDIK